MYPRRVPGAMRSPHRRATQFDSNPPIQHRSHNPHDRSGLSSQSLASCKNARPLDVLFSLPGITPNMTANPLRILVIGAHPDDADIMAGGTAALWARQGHVVKFVSVTNGDAGHHRLSGIELAAIRQGEAAAAGRVIGIEYDVLHFHDGRLEPTYAARCEIIGLIRAFRPDLVLTHRPCDYHPDHRYTSQLVCDAAYMVTVPSVVPDVPFLLDNPAIAYVADNFQRPYPFSPQVVVDIEPALDEVVSMLHCHQSQFYEWLAFNHGYETQLPPDEAGRRAWLGRWYCDRIRWLADAFRSMLIERYGADRGNSMRFIEAFEPCEYGASWDAALIAKLFPF